MRLSPEQVEHFYAIWKPLILFVNERLRLEPALLGARGDEPWDPQKVYTVRQALWADDALREAKGARSIDLLASARVTDRNRTGRTRKLQRGETNAAAHSMNEDVLRQVGVRLRHQRIMRGDERFGNRSQIGRAHV